MSEYKEYSLRIAIPKELFKLKKRDFTLVMMREISVATEKLKGRIKYDHEQINRH